MMEIPLTKGKVALITDNHFEDVKRFKWYACYCRGKWYARRDVMIDGKRKQIYMHRYIGKKLGFDISQVIDHKNGKGLDNQDDNLRGSTHQGNMANREGWSASSKYKGVYPRGDRWIALISYEGKNIYLGMFNKDIDAATAYDNKAVELYGQFAETNFAF